MSRSTHAVSVSVAVLLAALACASNVLAQSKVPRVGFLFVRDVRAEPWLENIRATLRHNGWIEGKSVAFEYRDAGGDPTRFAEPAADLVRMKVDVLFPIGPPAVRSVASVTRDIPIVAHDFETDPVIAGYAQSYGRPGGNITGLFLDSPDLTGVSG